MNPADVQRLVDDLSSGKRSRDPDAPLIAVPVPFKPVILDAPKPKVLGSVKFRKWEINTAEKFTVNLGGVRKMRSFLQDLRYYRKKKAAA
jgi:hypothetical protein